MLPLIHHLLPLTGHWQRLDVFGFNSSMKLKQMEKMVKGLENQVIHPLSSGPLPRPLRISCLAWSHLARLSLLSLHPTCKLNIMLPEYMYVHSLWKYVCSSCYHCILKSHGSIFHLRLCLAWLICCVAISDGHSIPKLFNMFFMTLIHSSFTWMAGTDNDTVLHGMTWHILCT